MDFWLYVYIALAIFFVFVVIWVYTQACEWWYVNVSGDTDHLQEIFIIENNQYHLLRSYLIETRESLDCARETLDLYTENCQSVLENWSKILTKEHFLKFSDLQRRRWNLYLSLIEGDEVSEISKELRSINRKISQIHEDWWGLKFDASGYMRELNDMDVDIIAFRESVENLKPSNDIFHSILFHQEKLEKKIYKVVG